MTRIAEKLKILQAKIPPFFLGAEGWSMASSLFLAACCVQWYVSSASFALKSFSDRAIGIVVLHAVDAAKRTNTYVFAIVLFALLFFVLLFLHDIFRKWLDQPANQTELKNYKRLIMDVSALGIFNIWWGLIQQSEQPLYSSLLILAIMLAAYLLLIGRRLFSGSMFVRQLERHSYGVLIALLIPVPIIFACRVIFKHSIIIARSDLIAYMGIAVFLLLAYGLFLKWCQAKGKLPDGMLGALTMASVPLLLIPASIPFSNELQYTLSNIIFNGRLVAISVFVVLLLFAVILFFLTYRQKSEERHIPAILDNVILPLLIGTIALYFYYSPKINLDQFDIFHHGENLITVQQMFQFGAIPFVDFFPTHGLSEAYPQILYCLLNGYSFVEPWLWNWMYALVSILLFFFLFKALLGPLKALLVAMFLPVNAIVGDYYITVVLPLLACAWAYSSNNTRTGWSKYLVLWIVNALIFLWRIDFGLACLMAVLVIYVLLQAHKFFNRQLSLGDIASFVMTGGFVLLSTFILLAGLCAYHAWPVNEVLAQILRFSTYQGQVGAYLVLYNQFSALVLVQYLLVPAVLLGCVIIFCLWMPRKDQIHTEQIILAYMAIFFLIISVRGTQMHCLVEGFAPFGVAFVSSLLFLIFWPKAKQAAFGVFLFVVVMNQVSLPLPPKQSALALSMPLPPKQPVLADRLKLQVAEGNKLKNGVSSGEIFSFQNWKNKERRVTYNDAQYKDVVRFLNQNLLPGQTFYEFYNSPLLYVAADKEMPAYLIPVVCNASDLIQNIQVKRLRKFWEANRLPFVVFNPCPYFPDSPYVIPTEVRSYRIAEFIYNHYRPMRGKLSGYQLWVDQRCSQTFNLLPDTEITHDFYLKKLPYIWGQYDQKQAAHTTMELQRLLDGKKLDVQPKQPITLSLMPDYDKSTGSYLHFRILAGEDAQVTVAYSDTNDNLNSKVTFDVVRSGTTLDYLVRMSCQWAWVAKPVNKVIITVTVPITIEGVYLRKGD